MKMEKKKILGEVEREPREWYAETRERQFQMGKSLVRSCQLGWLLNSTDWIWLLDHHRFQENNKGRRQIIARSLNSERGEIGSTEEPRKASSSPISVFFYTRIKFKMTFTYQRKTNILSSLVEFQQLDENHAHCLGLATSSLVTFGWLLYLSEPLFPHR